MLMGDEDDAFSMAEEATPQDISPKTQPPTTLEEIIKKVKDVRIEESGLVCSICLDEITKGSAAKCLPCPHKYHAHCIIKWFSKTNTCPLCRHRITPSP